MQNNVTPLIQMLCLPYLLPPLSQQVAYRGIHVRIFDIGNWVCQEVVLRRYVRPYGNDKIKDDLRLDAVLCIS
jgi:hypothetical protein